MPPTIVDVVLKVAEASWPALRIRLSDAERLALRSSAEALIEAGAIAEVEARIRMHRNAARAALAGAEKLRDTGKVKKADVMVATAEMASEIADIYAKAYFDEGFTGFGVRAWARRIAEDETAAAYLRAVYALANGEEAFVESPAAFLAKLGLTGKTGKTVLFDRIAGRSATGGKGKAAQAKLKVTPAPFRRGAVFVPGDPLERITRSLLEAAFLLNAMEPEPPAPEDD